MRSSLCGLMFATLPITGAELPDGSLVLTYDDGPGPNTLPVAEYLSGMGIEATFFVVGQFAEKQPEVLARLRGLGHRVGSHTWTHRNGGLTEQLVEHGAASVGGELKRTAALRQGTAEPMAFRAPWGLWSEAVAAALSADTILDSAHVGPIHWDID